MCLRIDPTFDLLNTEAPQERSDAADSLSILRPSDTEQYSDERDLWLNAGNNAIYSPPSRTTSFNANHRAEEGPLMDFFDFGSLLGENGSTLLDADSFEESSASPASSGLVQDKGIMATERSGLNDMCAHNKCSISIPYSVVDDLSVPQSLSIFPC
jgi:hypothetical protein